MKRQFYFIDFWSDLLGTARHAYNEGRAWDAEQLFLWALYLAETETGRNSVVVGQTLLQLWSFYHNEDRPIAAEFHYKRAREIFEPKQAVCGSVFDSALVMDSFA
jgi:hypothetical protein